MNELNARVAIITGGARGIGRACVERFLEAGAALVTIADIDGAAAEAYARAVDPTGKRTLAVATDVTVKSQVESMVERTAARGGRIDILVTSAGIAGAEGAMETQAEAALDRIWAVNVKGTYF